MEMARLTRTDDVDGRGPAGVSTTVGELPDESRGGHSVEVGVVGSMEARFLVLEPIMGDATAVEVGVGTAGRRRERTKVRVV